MNKTFLYIFFDIFSIFFCLALPSLFHHHLLVYMFSFLMIVRLQKSLAIIAHDGVHGLITTNRFLNDWISQGLLAGPIGRNYFLYKHTHCKHHLTTQSNSDPDLISDFQYADKKSAFLKKAISSLSGFLYFKITLLEFRYALKTWTWKNAAVICCIVLWQVILFTYCWTIDRPSTYFLVWLLPLVTLNTFFSYIRQISEHANLDFHKDPALCSRTVHNRIETFFISPHNCNLHAEHHANPSIPFHALRPFPLDVNTPQYSSYFAVIRELLSAS